MVELILYLIILFFPVFLWKVFEEAGYKSWQTIIPFYNYWIWLKIIQKPKWWFICWLIPFLNLFMIFLMLIETSKCYEKHNYGFYLLATLVPFLYFPYLGLSKKEHFTAPDQLKPYHKSNLRGWISALIWAAVLATILQTFVFRNYQIPTSSMERSLMVGDFLVVSNLTYGPKIPNTVLSLPFMHNRLPWSQSAKSYVEWIKLPFYRLPGFRDLKRNDNVVFNYPTGDTVIVERQNEDYYRVVREAERAFKSQLKDSYRPGMGRDYIWKNFNIISRPVDKCENYVKRCVAIAGDTLQIIDQQIYINGKIGENAKMQQTSYRIYTKDYPISDNKLRQLKISSEDIQIYKTYHILQLTKEMAETVKSLPNVINVEKITTPSGIGEPDILPYDTSWHWNLDNFGPMWIPQKGTTISLTKENIQLYRRCIEVYENNKFELKDEKVYLNGEIADTYTFKMDYYWMQGDNRHNSLDSRYFGFVPEDHIVGTPILVFFSKDKDAPLFNGGIRWKRLFSVPD